MEDRQHGYGHEKWSEGSEYVGVYTDGRKEGIGMYRWPNGNVFKGHWSGN